MNIILFDNEEKRLNLMPFTFLRPISDIRVGILTIFHKWRKVFKEESAKISYLTTNYLQPKYKTYFETENIYINGALCPDDELKRCIIDLGPEEVIMRESSILAFKSKQRFTSVEEMEAAALNCRITSFENSITILHHTFQIFKFNRTEILKDFPLVTKNKKNHGVSDPHTIVYGKDNIFVAKDVKIRAAVLNAEDGPIYLGKNSVVSEGALIRGAFALCENAQVSMGAKMRGDTTVGPYSKVGGEVGNSVIFGYSNKAHDGYLGNSVIAEWCNLGADSNTSNLKNNYSTVSQWNYATKTYTDTGEQFCGLMMGDHSKAGINTMFNTGSTVGICSNIFGGGFPNKLIPSFSWGGFDATVTARLDKMIDLAEKVMGRRNIKLTEKDKTILKEVYRMTAVHRDWE